MSDPTEELLDHVEAMIAYWSSVEGRSNVPPETSKADALDGLAFSLLVMLDGGAISAGSWYLAPIDERGEVGDPVMGALHERFAERRRKA